MAKQLFILATVLSIVAMRPVMAIEEPDYRVIMQDEKFELRQYEPYIQAQVLVDGEFDEAGNRAFRKLFNYISGANRSRREISMTAPVTQEVTGEEIRMTAPVTQESDQGRYVVSFVMPSSYTMETIPIPLDSAVDIRLVPARTVAVVRYSGRWSQSNYDKNKLKLERWIVQQGLTVTGDAVWARYNSPFSLWFMRRNEIMVPVVED